MREIHIKDYPLVAPFWKDEWQRVLSCTLSNMRRGDDYSENFFEDAQAMWIDFINKKSPDVPPRYEKLKHGRQGWNTA